MTKPHDCEFPEVEIGENDDDGILKAGMRVLLPCPGCGETPLDHLGVLEMNWEEAQASIQAIEPRRALFHWAPTSRRPQIIRYGLRPFMRPTTSINEDGYKANVICFADSPSWAWALSGSMSWAQSGSWDLWETYLDLLHEPKVLASPDRASGIYEVRTETRVYKRNLWYVASREKM